MAMKIMTKESISFKEPKVLCVIFSFNCSKEECNLENIQGRLELLTGLKIGRNELKDIIRHLVVSHLIDDKLVINNEILESLSDIGLKTKSIFSYAVDDDEYTRFVLIYKMLIFVLCEKGMQLNNQKLPIKTLQDRLKEVSGVNIKQEEIKIVKNAFVEEGIIDDAFNIKDTDRLKELSNGDINGEIDRLLDLEVSVRMNIWELVVFSVINCMSDRNQNGEMQVKEKTVSNEIIKLFNGNKMVLKDYHFGTIKKKLMEARLINKSLNIMVKDIPEGGLSVKPRLRVRMGRPYGVVHLDYNSFTTFHSLFNLGKDIPFNEHLGKKEILGERKNIFEQFSENNNENKKSVSSSVSLENLKYILSSLYAQGIINSENRIALDDVSEYEFIVNDEDMNEKRGALIQKCLNRMGCSIEEIELSYDSLIVFYAIYTFEWAEKDMEIGLNVVSKRVKDLVQNAFERKRCISCLMSLYNQGLIDKDFRVLKRDFDGANVIITMNSDVTVDENLLSEIAKKMNCHFCLDNSNSQELEDVKIKPNQRSCFEKIKGQNFSLLVPNHIREIERALLEKLKSKKYLESVIGKRGTPRNPEFLIYQEFLWERFGARTNKDNYSELVSYACRFIYENTYFFARLIGIKEPFEITKRLGIQISNDKLRKYIDERNDDGLGWVFEEFEFKEKLIYQYIFKDDDEMTPFFEQKDGKEDTEEFINFVKLIDDYDMSQKIKEIRDYLNSSYSLFPLPGALDVMVSSNISDKERNEKELENKNRRGALCLLLYGLYRVVKDYKN